MAFCSNCGARLIDGAMFCPECGTKQSVSGATTTQSYSPPPQQAYQQPAYQPPPQPAPQQQKSQVQYGSLKFEVVEKETLKFLKVDFEIMRSVTNRAACIICRATSNWRPTFPRQAVS